MISLVERWVTLRITDYTSEDIKTSGNSIEENQPMVALSSSYPSWGGFIDSLSGILKGMPPEDDEQPKRLSYVNQVFNTHYNKPKYESNTDKYQTYLYLSHFVDNVHYSYNSNNSSVHHSSFNSYLTHIIGAQDIAAYNTFLDYQQHAFLMTSVSGSINSFNNLKDKMNELDLSTQELIDEINSDRAHGIGRVNELTQQVAEDLDITASEAKELVNNLLNLTAKSYKELPVDEMSERLYEQIEEYTETNSIQFVDLSGTVIEAFEGLINDVATLRHTGGMIAGSCLALDAVANAYHFGALGSLRSTFSGRYGQRIYIEYGLIPWP